MSKIFRTIAIVGVIGVMVVAAIVDKTILTPSQPAVVASGTSNFNVVEGIPYTVSNTILPTDTTITLSSFNSPGGLPFTMANFGTIGYATLDPTNLARLETVSFTGITHITNGVQLTGVTRGIDFVYPYSASTTLERVHLVGSNLILSNPAAFYGQQFAFTNATTTIFSNWTFSSTSPPEYDNDPTWVNFPGTALADINYVNSVVASGCANASQTVKGCVQLATQIQSASSTATGSTGALLVLPASIATSSNDVAGLHVVITQNNGKINWNMIDLTQNLSFSGSNTYAGIETFNNAVTNNATSTFNAYTVGVNITNVFIAGDIISLSGTVPIPVSIATTDSGRVAIVDGNVATTTNFIGFAVTSATVGNSVYVQTGGIVGGFSGLTAGMPYYVSDTAGTLSTTIGTYEVYVGVAVSATQIFLDKGPRSSWQYMGSLSAGTGYTSIPIGQQGWRFAVFSGGGGAAQGSLTLSIEGNQSGQISSQSGGSPDFQVGAVATASSTGVRLQSGGDSSVPSGTFYFYR